MPRKDHLPRQTRQEHITLQPNRSIEFRVTDDFGSFSPPHWHDALEIIYILEGSSIVTLSDRTKTVFPGQFLLINSGRIHTARCPSTGNRSILMQIPDAFLANYLPDPSQLWFSIDYDSTNPEVQKNISQFRRLLLSMMQLHEEMPDGYLLTTESVPTFKFRDESIGYSASREIDYQNEDVDVSIYYNGSGFVAGDYKIELYTDGYVLGTAAVAMR